MEKCSESIGMRFVLYLFKNLFKISHPQIIASLLARSNFFVNLMKFKVIGRPLIPGTALTVISNFFF